MNRSIPFLVNQMEEFIVRRTSPLPAEHKEMMEALALAEMLRRKTEPSKRLCARLRARALTTQRFSPVISAHMDLIADELEANPYQ